MVGSAVELFSDCILEDVEERGSELKQSSSAMALDASPSQSPVRVIRLPAEPALVRWSLFFFCPIAHPTVMARRQVRELSQTVSELAVVLTTFL